MYATDLVSSVATPNQELVGFKKVLVRFVPLPEIPEPSLIAITTRAGSSETVTIPVKSAQLAVWTVKQKWVVEPGQFLIKVGTSDQTFLSTTLTVR